MSDRKLESDILRSVSRSFYLSIRILPKAVRRPIGVAYLLARTSDTIADTSAISVSTRLRRLEDFENLLRGRGESDTIAAIQNDIQPEHDGERALIAALPGILELFENLETWNRTETSALMEKIIRAQANDLRTFADSTRIVALENAAELEEYTYLVAGCVGEWWTRVCFHHLPAYSRLDPDHATSLANSFGKALQLVNILRDLRTDFGAGRCYLPADELHSCKVAPEQLHENPLLAQPVVDRWLSRARSLLGQARTYIASVRVRRVRLACYLPWRLADKTLDLLEKRSPLATPGKLKVSRSEVRTAMWEGFRVAFLNKSF
jgi:farnesyl-diphosphate farnesyltransferase